MDGWMDGRTMDDRWTDRQMDRQHVKQGTQLNQVKAVTPDSLRSVSVVSVLHVCASPSVSEQKNSVFVILHLLLLALARWETGPLEFSYRQTYRTFPAISRPYPLPPGVSV